MTVLNRPTHMKTATAGTVLRRAAFGRGMLDKLMGEWTEFSQLHEQYDYERRRLFATVTGIFLVPKKKAEFERACEQLYECKRQGVLW